MQELQAKVTQAQVEIIDREKFEQNINEVVTKYQNYVVTASTIKDDKKVLADLRKLSKQISDERIKIKKELSKSADEFDEYIKATEKPLTDTIFKIAKDVKDFEDHQKALRLDTVKSYIANKSAEYMLDPRIFDEKALEYIKASDFMADGVTLKKATMQSLDDLVTFEFQKQQEFEKAKSAISGQCAEYGMTDQPYLRMLRDLTLVEVLEQIKADYVFEKQKEEVRLAQERAEREQQEILAKERAKQEADVLIRQKMGQIDPETGEILDGGELSRNQEEAVSGAENSLKKYTQKMILEVYFEDTEDKDRFKNGLSQLGFDYKTNYIVKGYQNIEPLTQSELEELFK
jgi:phage protein